MNLEEPATGEVPDVAALTAAACLFRGLGDPTRLAILGHLALGEHRVVDLTAHLGLAQSTVSAHVACLRGCGLVDVRPEGRASWYSLAARPEVLDLLASAERLLTATGDAVVLCPRTSVAGGGSSRANVDPVSERSGAANHGQAAGS